MRAVPMPPVGGRIQVDFPRLSVPYHSSGRYIVADIDGDDTITVWPVGGYTPEVRAGTPCLVEYRVSARRLTVGAIALNSGPGGVVMHLHTGDQRRFPRLQGPVAMTIEVPSTDLGVVDGVTEAVSLGGLRATVPVALPADQRAFVSISVVAADPILAAARTLACAPAVARGSHIVRVQFTVVSSSDHARLCTLLHWPVLEPTNIARRSPLDCVAASQSQP
jgi:hypothetical protein